MVVRLDGRNVKTLPAVNGRRTTYRDDPSAPGGVRGLILRVSPTGARSYALEYSHRDKSRKYTIGPTERVQLSEARKIARDVYIRILQGHDPAAEKAQAKGSSLTVDDLVARMLKAINL